MSETNRISSIDVMRGLIILLMLFVTGIYMPGVPSWPGNAKADFDGMGFADWLLPGFLFLAGMAIPFSIGKRAAEGENATSIGKHILIRTISLLIIGVLMINSERVNEEFTGMGKNLWTILMYTGVFLIWNNYQRNDKNFFTIEGLKLAGIAILVFLIFRFRSGEFENNGSLITGWWGIPGMIGWGYLISAFTYLAVRDNILNTVVALLFFLSFNILSELNLLISLNPVKSIFGVIIEGTVPFIMISGMLTSLILKKNSQKAPIRTIIVIVVIGIIILITGFILRQWFIISKIQAAPGWGLIYTGISMMFFSLVYWIVDVKKQSRLVSFLKPVDEYPLTTYIALNMLYAILLSTGIPVLIYKQSGISLIVIAGSVIWALLIVKLTALLIRNNIRLKL